MSHCQKYLNRFAAYRFFSVFLFFSFCTRYTSKAQNRLYANTTEDLGNTFLRDTDTSFYTFFSCSCKANISCQWNIKFSLVDSVSGVTSAAFRKLEDPAATVLTNHPARPAILSRLIGSQSRRLFQDSDARLPCVGSPWEMI